MEYNRPHFNNYRRGNERRNNFRPSRNDLQTRGDTEYKRPYHRYENQARKRVKQFRDDRQKPISFDPVENFVNSVTKQEMGGAVIALGSDDHPYVALANSLKVFNENFDLQIVKEPQTSEFTLSLNGQEFVKGSFPNIKEAKIGVGWLAIDKFHHTNFTILKKDKKYIQVPDDVLKRAKFTKSNADSASTSESPSGGSSKNETNSPPKNETNEVPESKTEGNSAELGQMTGSIAHRMMMKMGWKSGKGLGVQEQGITASIVVNENVDRQGLGHSDVTGEIKRLLIDYSRSNKITALAFSKDFTKEEREVIHKFCAKLKSLKTKSVGYGEDRYITVSRKIRSIDIVKELLKIGCENEHYKLVIPGNFVSLYESTFHKKIVDDNFS